MSEQEATTAVREFFDSQYRQYERYWWQGDNRYSLDPRHHTALHARTLELAASAARGRVLDVGAGEGADAIRLALLGYDVDAVEVSSAGAAKIETFARSCGARLNVINADIADLRLHGTYAIVICNGSLHYIAETAKLLTRLQAHTTPGGLHVVSAFSDASPMPECHRWVRLHPDSARSSTILGAYDTWETVFIQRESNKLEASHPGFPPHRHSYIKLIAQNGCAER